VANHKKINIRQGFKQNFQKNVSCLKLSSMQPRLLKHAFSAANPSSSDTNPNESDRALTQSHVQLPLASPYPSLATLTLAALALPGLAVSVASAADKDGVDFQYGRYQEGPRTLHSVDTSGNVQRQFFGDKLRPIEVDNLRMRGRFTFKDRIRLILDYTQDTWSGATPIATAPIVSLNNGGGISGASPYLSPDNTSESAGIPYFFDQQFNFYNKNVNNVTRQVNTLAHTMSSASPETRKQGDIKLSYEWNEAALTLGGGVSEEHDYHSRFGSVAGRLDFNQKRTTLNFSGSYTHSETDATFDPTALGFLSVPFTVSRQLGFRPAKDSEFRTQATRSDWGLQLGLTQILTRNAFVNFGVGYTDSSGYLANPYKAVTVVGFSATPAQLDANRIAATTQSILEQRPNERRQFVGTASYRHYIAPFNSALHLDYRYFQDDWDIHAHTMEAQWLQPIGNDWMVTPRVRYYTQSSADFYHAFLLQGTVKTSIGRPIAHDLNRFNVLPEHYSSDHRLSGFGTLSAGVTVTKEFVRGVTLETGFEYYTHQGGLKLGGGSEQSFADFNFWTANAALKINPSALGITNTARNFNASGYGTGQAVHSAAHAPIFFNAPAGIMFDHALPQAGQFMLGYRYLFASQNGSMLSGTQRVSIDEVNRNACGDLECAAWPSTMTTNMHMLEVMFAPTRWATLMLMPQWMDMNMAMESNANVKLTGGHASHSSSALAAARRHETGGIGDLGMYTLFKLWHDRQHQLTLSIGATAPTGDANIHSPKEVNQSANKVINFGMQTGSGTWDFKPTLTYSGGVDKLFWGVQAGGTVRLEKRNDSGYSFGDVFHTSAWGGLRWTNWMSFTARGLYTSEGKVVTDGPPKIILADEGPMQHYGPFDFGANYGGRFVDVGLGVNVHVPGGSFAGHSARFEWLQPVHTDYNGYQLDRDGALRVTWQYGF